uniref:ubiquitin-conjugating enzyme E2 E1 isoform X1 n=1 Tax=Ictidomys tridecemlineatus TaxID=43179 RepID=UPI001A9F9FDE|nr:ubiquitin-conjugating enzyme E2 E1 isoform X1 [Ictidomys tridecemlineatus]
MMGEKIIKNRRRLEVAEALRPQVCPIHGCSERLGKQKTKARAWCELPGGFGLGVGDGTLCEVEGWCLGRKLGSGVRVHREGKGRPSKKLGLQEKAGLERWAERACGGRRGCTCAARAGAAGRRVASGPRFRAALSTRSVLRAGTPSSEAGNFTRAARAVCALGGVGGTRRGGGCRAASPEGARRLAGFRRNWQTSL